MKVMVLGLVMCSDDGYDGGMVAGMVMVMLVTQVS